MDSPAIIRFTLLTDTPKYLGFVERYLSLWVFIAMAGGVALGRFSPGFKHALACLQANNTPFPIACCLFLMMYPPLAKIRYEELPHIFMHTKLLLLSLVQNWIIGPILMFFLAIFFLQGHPDYMIGLIIIGLAPCIAMVLIWNELADGDIEYCAGLAAFNSIFQLLFFPFYAYLFATVLPNWLGITSGLTISITLLQTIKNILIYLGIPFFVGVLTRFFLVRRYDAEWYEEQFLPKIKPLTLYASLFIILMVFALQAGDIMQLPINILHIAALLAGYFIVMFLSTLYISAKIGANYRISTTLSLTAAGNNFNLAIVMAIAVFGLQSGQTLAAVTGLLIEVPVLALLVKSALYFRPKYAKR